MHYAVFFRAFILALASQFGNSNKALSSLETAGTICYMYIRTYIVVVKKAHVHYTHMSDNTKVKPTLKNKKNGVVSFRHEISTFLHMYIFVHSFRV
jgi:hypothetical protein